LAQKIETSALKPGMMVFSQRTASVVYTLGTHLSDLKTFPMKGKAIVLQEPTKVRLKMNNSRWDAEKKVYVSYETHMTRTMVLLSHFKHGIVMYLYMRSNDCKWRLLKDKTETGGPNAEVSAGSAG
jgi:hypothetical protein